MNTVRGLWPTSACVGIVLLVAGLLLFPGLGSTPLDDPGEGMHAEIAREILQSGDWITLHLNGVRYFDKPPLLYWLTAQTMRVWGPTEGSARLWPVLGTFGAVAATALLGIRLLSLRAGCVAGLALLTSLGFFAYARYLRPESLFVAMIQWSFTLLLVSDGTRHKAVLWCAALGLAGLAKDPLGMLGPLVAVAVAKALVGKLRPVSRWLPLGGVALILLVGAIWYVLVELRNRGFLWYTVVDNHLLNAVQARYFPDEDVPLTSLEFLAVAAMGAFPWIIPAGLSIFRLFRWRAWREEAEFPWIVLALWTVGVYCLFALVRFKLPHYGLPAYPALALLAARYWEEERRLRPLLVVHLIVFSVLALTCACVYESDGNAFESLVFTAADPYTRKELVIAQTTPLPPWEVFRNLIGATALVFGAGSFGLFVAVKRRSRTLGLYTVLLTLIVLMPLAGQALSSVQAVRSVKQMSQWVRDRAQPQDLLVHEGPIENSGGLELYCGRRPVILDGRTSVLGFGATFSEGQDVFWDRARLKEAWHGPRQIFLVTIRDFQNSVISDLPAEEVRCVAVGGGRWLYTNRPAEKRAITSNGLSGDGAVGKTSGVGYID